MGGIPSVLEIVENSISLLHRPFLHIPSDIWSMLRRDHHLKKLGNSFIVSLLAESRQQSIKHGIVDEQTVFQNLAKEFIPSQQLIRIAESANETRNDLDIGSDAGFHHFLVQFPDKISPFSPNTT